MEILVYLLHAREFVEARDLVSICLRYGHFCDIRDNEFSD